jgi:signal transduction histidine kinase
MLSNKAASWPNWGFLPGFIAAYVALDWTSYISPLQGLNLTPWNPAPALGLLLLIRQGHLAVFLLFTAIVLGDTIIRHMPAGLPATLVIDAILTTGYVLMARLLRHRFPDGGLFIDRHGLLVWSAIVIVGSLINGIVFVSVLQMAGVLADDTWHNALIRFWIGDAVGIYVTMPLLWWLIDSVRRRLFLANLQRLETWSYLVLALLSLWAAFSLGEQTHFRYFYILFLPVVWAASRQGLTGAILSATLLQLGMLFVSQFVASEEISVLEMQTRAFLIALVAFLIGSAVDDHRRASAELKHSLRLAAAGEMAAALAHELNQPLTALTAYGAACEKMLTDDQESNPTLHQAVQRMVAEANRAAEVVRRLKDFFRSGAIRLEVVSLVDLIDTAVRPFRAQAVTRNIQLIVGDIPPEARLQGDRLQLEVVLRNLLANAFDALADHAVPFGRVKISVQVRPNHRIAIMVEDNGPGPSPDMATQLFEPFSSTKSSGLGLGLAISRAIAEAHGGSLQAYFRGHGCFRLVLPLEPPH